MNRRERLMNTLNGESVDRPPVCFYEINGLTQDPNDPDPFNIYNHPSWRPLIDLAAEKSDRIVLKSIPFKSVDGADLNPAGAMTSNKTWMENGSRMKRKTVKIGARTLESTARRDPDVNTTWQIEHLLKDVDDLKAWLTLPEPETVGVPDATEFLDVEKRLGDTGIAAIDTPDPLCCVAPLFSMETYLITALTERELFRKALDKVARQLHPKVEAVAKALPGRLWRICGPEYASPPYLPPALFDEYVVGYVKPMVDAIQRHGGYARVHSHGRLKDILDLIAETGCVGLDPIEPPPQGDVTLAHVREKVGRQMVLFGNLEISDIENLSPKEMEEKVKIALDEGTRGDGRGFVLMPSACPYGREVSPNTMRNYETIVRLAC